MSHKKPKSKKKEQKKLAQKAKSVNKKREKYNNITKVLDIEKEFKFLPLILKKDLWSFSLPQIQVCTKNIIGHKHCEFLKESIFQELERKKLEINSENISLLAYSDFISFYAFMLGVYRDINTPEIYDKYHTYFNIIEKVYFKIKKVIDETYGEYSKKVFSVASKLTLQFYSFENGLYPKLISYLTKTNKIGLKIELNKINIKKEIISIDKGPRAAYLCPTYDGVEVSPLFVEKNTIGNSEKIPVYIQEHAINRLFERLSIKTQGYLLDCVGISLRNPKISGYDGAYLIDYNFYSYKLGYLIVSNFGNMAVVRSFKFITMTGTPEFYAISKKLKTTKHDVTYLGLDTLDVFVNSDLSKDPKLIKVFTECGLGHLFKFGETIQSDIYNVFENPRNTVAEEIKKYLNL